MKFSLERGKQLYQSKRYNLALRELEGVGIDNTDNPELIYYTGLCFTKLEQWEKALFYLEQVVNLEFSFLHHYQCRMVLGYIYSITGRYKLAEYEFQKMTESGMESTQVYASLGFIAYSQRKVDESIVYLKKALELKPGYTTALNSLGYIYAEEGIDIPKAVKLCKEAVSQNPNSGAYLDSLGWAYYKAGKLNDARTHLRKALDIMPGNKTIARHLRAVVKQ